MKTQVKPRKAPRQLRSQATVDAILDATARVLVRSGYAKANTNAIAEVAGVSVGSLYQYFLNKESLVAALHQRHVNEMQAMYAAVVADSSPRTLEQSIAEMVRVGVAAHRLQPKLHKVLDEVPHLPHSAQHEDTDRQIRQSISRLALSHRDEIKVRNLNLAAFIVCEMVHALIHSTVIDPPPEFDDAAIERETVRAVMAYLTHEPAPAQSRKRRVKSA